MFQWRIEGKHWRRRFERGCDRNSSRAYIKGNTSWSCTKSPFQVDSWNKPKEGNVFMYLYLHVDRPFSSREMAQFSFPSRNASSHVTFTSYHYSQFEPDVVNKSNWRQWAAALAAAAEAPAFATDPGCAFMDILQIH